MKNFREVIQSSALKKQIEIDNYVNLISVYTDFEKFTLIEYSENDDSKLVLFNPKNSDLCLKLVNIVNINYLLDRKMQSKILITHSMITY